MHRLTVDRVADLVAEKRDVARLGVEVQADPSETITLKGMYFLLVDNQVLSTQGQPDVFNLHRLTSPESPASAQGQASNKITGEIYQIIVT